MAFNFQQELKRMIDRMDSWDKSLNDLNRSKEVRMSNFLNEHKCTNSCAFDFAGKNESSTNDVIPLHLQEEYNYLKKIYDRKPLHK